VRSFDQTFPSLSQVSYTCTCTSHFEATTDTRLFQIVETHNPILEISHISFYSL